ncbi:hypothetical protein D3C84_522560 [compost metagenome]
METEDGDVAVAAVAGWLILIAGAEGVTGIFDDAEVILLPQAMELFHIAGKAGKVHRDYYLG